MRHENVVCLLVNVFFSKHLELLDGIVYNLISSLAWRKSVLKEIPLVYLLWVAEALAHLRMLHLLDCLGNLLYFLSSCQV